MTMKILNKLYRLFNLLPKNSFKVVEVTGSAQNKDLLITYQVCGTSSTTKERPETIVDALMQIKGFSKEDSEIIYTLAVTEKLMPNFKITNIIFEKDGALFEIEDIQFKSLLKLSAEEIINSQNLINNLPISDVIKIQFQYIKETAFDNKIHKKLEIIHADHS